MDHPELEPPPAPRRRWLAAVQILMVVAAVLGLWLTIGRGTERPEVDYSTAYGWIKDGKVKSVELSATTLDAELAAHEQLDGRTLDTFRTTVPKDDSLVPLLRDKGVKIRVVPERSGFAALLISVVPWVILLGAWFWISRRSQRAMIAGGPLGGLAHKARKFEKSTAPPAKFDDIAGLAAAKADLQEIVLALKEPQRVVQLGAKIPRGVLLVGPPGTGKTLIARAVAGEANVPFFSITGSEFIEVFVGVGAARVRQLFEQAKQAAPAIVFIDEIDAVGRVRGSGLGGGNDEREQTLNQMLAEMDGFERHDTVVVIAATNRPDVLDPALLRPGRFDRRVVIDLPELAARKDILAVHVRGKPVSLDVKLEEIAKMTPGFSGADLANLVNEAALHAMRENADHIDHHDFIAAYDKIVLGDPREGHLTVTEKKRVAIHEGGHAVVAWMLPQAEPLRRVSILPRGMALGATEQLPAEHHLLTRGELEARLAVLLGGYAAELMIHGEPSTGAERDLREATRLAEQMVAHYGMSEELGAVYYEHHEQHAFLGHRIATDGGPSDATVRVIDEQSRQLLARARDTARMTLEAHRRELEALSARLIAVETIERDELERLLGDRLHAASA